MKPYLNFIIFLFITSTTLGQINDKNVFVGNVLSDTTNLDSDLFKDVLPPILKSNNSIEIRFLIAPDMKVDTLKTLYYDGQWNAKAYNLDTKKELTVVIDTNKEQLSQIFKNLVKNDIFNLRDESFLNINPTSINLETGETKRELMGVLHSTIYIVQFKVGKFYRLYGFSSPKPHGELHPNITEYKNYNNIVEIFNSIK